MIYEIIVQLVGRFDSELQQGVRSVHHQGQIRPYLTVDIHRVHQGCGQDAPDVVACDDELIQHIARAVLHDLVSAREQPLAVGGATEVVPRVDADERRTVKVRAFRVGVHAPVVVERCDVGNARAVVSKRTRVLLALLELLESIVEQNPRQGGVHHHEHGQEVQLGLPEPVAVLVDR